MNGSDHLFPQPRLGRVVAEANDLQDDLVFEVTSLPDYLATAPTDGLERWKGELRSGFRSNMLMGVTSNRVDVKRLGALAERALEKRAEPLAALFQAPAQWPGELLAVAWKEMVRNSAHDSICACSVDDVVDAVLHRYAEARAIATGLADRAVTSLSRSLVEPGNYVLSIRALTDRDPNGSVELVVIGCAEPPGRPTRTGHIRASRSPRSRWCSTPTRSAACWACCRDRRSTTTPGSTTSSSKRTTRESTSR